MADSIERQEPQNMDSFNQAKSESIGRFVQENRLQRLSSRTEPLAPDETDTVATKDSILAKALQMESAAQRPKRETLPADEQDFEAHRHVQELYKEVEKLTDNPLVHEFFAQLHPQDIKDLRVVLSFISDQSANISTRGLSDWVRSQIKNAEKEAAATKPHNKTTLQEMFKKFSNDFYKDIDNAFPPERVLGLSKSDSLVPEKALARNTAIYKELWVYGKRPSADFVRTLVDRAYQSVRREAEVKARGTGKDAVLPPRPPETATVEKELPQTWLNQKREKAFEKMRSQLQELIRLGGQESIRETFMEMFNPAFRASEIEQLKSEDVSSLVYIDIRSASASKIAGREIVRPAFVFTDFGQYQQFSRRLQGERGLSSRGMIIPGEVFDESSDSRETGLLIGTNDKNFLGHESLHSIDPTKRRGYDRLLSELFAHYQQTIVEANPKHHAHKPKPEEGSWQQLAGEVSSDVYYEPYSQETEHPVSMEQFRQLSQQAVASARKLADQHGHLETQRSLVQLKTLQELFELTKDK